MRNGERVLAIMKHIDYCILNRLGHELVGSTKGIRNRRF